MNFLLMVHQLSPPHRLLGISGRGKTGEREIYSAQRLLGILGRGKTEERGDWESEI